MAIPDWLISDERVVGIRHHEAIAGVSAEWPEWLPGEIRDSLTAAGIHHPWQHQVTAAQHLWSGRHVALSTPTASGKSLAYLMPIMAATAVDPARARLGVSCDDLRSRLGVARHTALHLAPTKALAHDQLTSARRLGPKGWLVGALDGDSSPAERQFARDHAGFLFSNPDMIHFSVLPNHTRWARFLSSLRYVVIDEAHYCRGVFGSQVGQVIRRLRRLCAVHGAEPTFILTSATMAQAGRSGAELIGEPNPLIEVAEDSSPHSGRDVVCWAPASDAPHDAAELMAGLVDAGMRVLTFVRSRAQAELVALWAAKHSTSGRAIASYRAGYLAEDRRALEKQLRSGELGGVASTSALELGIDIAGLDAVVITGFPGSLAAFWQQAGRAGRGADDALVVLVAKDDPLDAHLMAHPELIFDHPVERTVLHPSNKYVLAPHLAAAAQEQPLTPDDERWFGPTMTGIANQLSVSGLLRRRPTGWYWTQPQRAVDSIDLRGGTTKPVEIVEEASGRVIGSVDRGVVERTVHTGAVYLHQSEQWLVRELNLDDRVALVKRSELPYYTQARVEEEIHILAETDRRDLGRGVVCRGEIEMASQVTSFLRRDEQTGEVWDETPLELPMHRMRTRAMWWLVPDEVVAELQISTVQLGGGIHAAEHTAIGLLPAFAPCDRWDIGGLSAILHPDTGTTTIFVHDGADGGAGFAEYGYEIAEKWWAATRERLRSCSCDAGCPSCCISPKCGNANQMLDKHSAADLLEILLGSEPG
ncbi:hypothetical protein HMPREF1531_01297 [Propionibacterium sp. oral taxon 192 str. F0372]|uniref:DEAD/DEAH box helicase n=1 Tax=Propionibacterium sp. oral taxon 192 TaxID=671222 RepID=UPI000352D583|nr:DEAD/DEAH box helicase [Propionibacterium sp. oral taxon 192]EPH03239.1 hypothetical protein HMPREF1531_01297 [Propionibacterium sp. oral taxon 192 str. F0372]